MYLHKHTQIHIYTSCMHIYIYVLRIYNREKERENESQRERESLLEAEYLSAIYSPWKTKRLLYFQRVALLQQCLTRIFFYVFFF